MISPGAMAMVLTRLAVAGTKHERGKFMADRQIDYASHLASALGVDTKEAKPMGQLDSFADDVNEVVADLNKQFEFLNTRKQKLKARGTQIAARWSQHFDAQEASLAAAEAALNRISNVPASQEKTNGG